MKQNIIFKQNLNTDFSINHTINKNWSMNEFHFHDVFEIYYGMSDDIKCFVEDRVYDVKKGDLLVFNHMELHKTIVPPDIIYDRYVLTFKPDYIEELSTVKTNLLECFIDRPANFDNRIHLSNEQRLSLLTLFDKAEKHNKPSTYASDVYLKLILAEILILVNSYYKISNKPSTKNKSSYYEKIKPIFEYINNNLDQDLSLEKLSSTFYLSKYHLGFLFKKTTGFSVTEYIIHRRIIKAKSLLKDNLPVSLVCEEAGFNNQCHFIRTFKKLVGISPKQYSLKT